MRVWVARFACLGLIALAHSSAHAAAVDPSRSASARALFEEGVAYTDRDQWGPAAEAFRAALALRDSQVIRFNLASALVELGKLVEASELLHVVQADTQADPALKQQAADKLLEVKPRIASLSIHAEAVLPGLEVELDDMTLTLAQLDLPLRVDPGKHVLRERVAGALIDEQSVELIEGGNALITLHAPAPEPVLVAKAAPVPLISAEQTARLAPAEPGPNSQLPLRDDASATPSRKKLWWGVAVGGLGAAAFVTLVALFVPRHQTKHSASGDFDPPSVAVRVPR
jgi:hypothetical protein